MLHLTYRDTAGQRQTDRERKAIHRDIAGQRQKDRQRKKDKQRQKGRKDISF